MKPLLIACDFDGTVTRQDSLVEILNTFGSPHWRQIQTRVASGALSIREGLQAEMESVQASPEELRALVVARVEIDLTFPSFLKAVQSQGIPLILLSGGFDLCVDTVLSKSRIGPLPYLANRLIHCNGADRGRDNPSPVHATLHSSRISPSPLEGEGEEVRRPTENPSLDAPSQGGLAPSQEGTGHSSEGVRWRVEFPYPSSTCSACGHCKGDPIRAWNAQGYITVFAGNGVTDRCPARVARLTFAKDELESWCRSQGIAAVPFNTFDDIRRELVLRGWL
jgi:HAD superfamily phosphoserine phosphatase-like hydrolase